MEMAVHAEQTSTGDPPPARQVAAQDLEVSLVPAEDPSPIGLGGFGLTLFPFSPSRSSSSGSRRRASKELCYLSHSFGEVRPSSSPVCGPSGTATRSPGWPTRHTAPSGWPNAAYVRYVVPGLPASHVSQATGVFLLAWTLLTLYLTVAAMKTNVAVLATFVVLLVLFVVLTAATYAQSPLWTKIAGGLAVLDALMAFYLSAGITIESVWGRALLPFGRSLA